MEYFNSITSWFAWGTTTEVQEDLSNQSDDSTSTPTSEDKKEDAKIQDGGDNAGVAVGDLVNLADGSSPPSVSTPEEGSVGDLVDLGDGSMVGTDDGEGGAMELKRIRSGGR